MRAARLADVFAAVFVNVLARVSIAAVSIGALTSCGPSQADRLRDEVATAAGPALQSFEADLEAGRVDEAMRRATVAFQGAAPAASVRLVRDQLRAALGAVKSRRAVQVDEVVSEGDPPQPRSAVLTYDAAFERGPARVWARVERDASRGGWRLDGYEVRNDLFTWTLRR